MPRPPAQLTFEKLTSFGIRWKAGLGIALFGLLSTSPAADYDLVIRNAMLYDGSGNRPVTGEIAVNGETIAAMGKLEDARGRTEIDAGGMAVAPGFINMLSWANESLIHDGLSQSDI